MPTIGEDLMPNENQPDKPTGKTTPRDAQKGGQGAIPKGEAQRQFDRDQKAKEQGKIGSREPNNEK
jgi:hypothetical protein